MRQRTICQTRRTFASLMISSGEDINWVARMMGDRVETVLRHYHRYLSDKERRDGARFLEKYQVSRNT